ncbi:hypothetical protein L1887_29372 [Cichorium endivia]|nr:hypothetical protein L1887_29372 [Cichorium endivia]
MYPKLSMEVSKETWVCSVDFIRHHSCRKPPPVLPPNNSTDGQDELKAMRMADNHSQGRNDPHTELEETDIPRKTDVEVPSYTTPTMDTGDFRRDSGVGTYSVVGRRKRRHTKSGKNKEELEMVAGFEGDGGGFFEAEKIAPLKIAPLMAVPVREMVAVLRWLGIWGAAMWHINMADGSECRFWCVREDRVAIVVVVIAIYHLTITMHN